MTAYQRQKAAAMREAEGRLWILNEPGIIVTPGERTYWRCYFSALGRRFGLIKDFREMGLI